MTEFAAALNKQHLDEIAKMQVPELREFIERVNQRVDAVERRIAKLEAALTNPKMASDALPAAPATNPDPTA
jgi:hypothetical protein